MADVAAAANVSTATVSYVLSGKSGRIPESTQERVLKASRALGYRTNRAARSLRRRSSDIIGLVSDKIASTPFAGLMIHGAGRAAAAAGKTLMIVDTEGDPAVEARAIDSMLEHQVDGVIYAAMWHRIVESPERLRETPTVFLDARTERARDSWVVPDEERGGFEATCHLIERGHQRIGYLREDNIYPADRERVAGYRRALAEHGIAFDPQLVGVGTGDAFGGHEAAVRLLELDDRPTAIQCYTDQMAMGAYRAVRRAGLSVPDDVSVIGFDNQEHIAPNLDPPLTTMELPHEAMGRWAVEELLRTLNGPFEGPRQVRMECPLIVRDSVTPPRDRRDHRPSQTSTLRPAR